MDRSGRSCIQPPVVVQGASTETFGKRRRPSIAEPVAPTMLGLKAIRAHVGSVQGSATTKANAVVSALRYADTITTVRALNDDKLGHGFTPAARHVSRDFGE